MSDLTTDLKTGQQNFEPRENRLRSARFRVEREESWKQLQALVERAEKNGVRSFTYQEAQDLNRLYRLTLNSLSVARSISLDKALLDYLDQLSARAYLVVYAPQQSLSGIVSRQLIYGIPQAVRQNWVALFLGFFAMFLGVFIGFELFHQDVEWFYRTVGNAMADGRAPGASVEYLRSTMYDGGDLSADRAGSFATKLFSHNTRIAIFVFALGAFAALPSYLLTFYNGIILGVFYALFYSEGLGYDMLAWLSIHGVTEISAICVACAAGSKLGMAFLLPGELTRGESLKRAGKDATKLVILAGLMLIVAAIVEGYFRQWVQSPQWRLIIGWGLGIFWLTWLLLSGRGSAHTESRT